MQLSYVYAQFDFICIVIMTMITIKSVTLTRSLKLQKMYLLMMFFAMCLVISDLLYELTDYGALSLSMVWVYLFNIIYFISSLAISYTWFIYTLWLINSKLANKLVFHILTGFPMFALTIMSFSTYYTKWLFYFDESGYHRGSLNIFYIAMPLLYFVLATCITLVNFLKNRTAESFDYFKTIVSFVAFPIAAVIIQVFNVGFPAVCIGASLGMLQVFLSNIAKDREALIVHDSLVKSKNDFFAGMSHEIRTPINAIIGMDTMILREAEDENIRGYARSIDNSSKILLTLVNDILDISKIEEGKMNLVPTDYSLKNGIRDLIVMFESRASEKGLKFISEIDETLPCVVNGDEVRLKQVIINILTNAVKYTGSGHIKLDVHAEHDNPADEKILRLRVTVSDTGCGMKKDQLDKLFMPYERFDEQQNRKAEGTGLGMTISKHLLNLMGSNMEVESTYGEGSTFSFAVNLPIVDATPIGKLADENTSKKNRERGKANTYVPSIKAPGFKILYVDDTIVNLKVFKALLKGTEIEIDTAGSGREALEMVSKVAYNLLFIDIMMPEMDGIETLKLIRKSSNLVNDGIPAIACTANALLGAREEYMSKGFDNYISKPIEASRLEELISEYI